MNEGLALFTDDGFRRELNFLAISDDLLLNDLLLTHLIPKRFLCVEHLEEDHADTPDVDFIGYLHWHATVIVFCDETLRWEVPVRTEALTREFYSRRVVLDDLRKTEVSDLYLPAVKDYVLRF